MRHRFEVIKSKEGTRYKCKKCGNVYAGSHATKIPCPAKMRLAVTDKVLKRSKLWGEDHVRLEEKSRTN